MRLCSTVSNFRLYIGLDQGDGARTASRLPSFQLRTLRTQLACSINNSEEDGEASKLPASVKFSWLY